MTGHRPRGIYEACFKRPLDFVLSAWALFVLWPLMALIGLFVYLKLGTPVLFKQKRPGRHGKSFLLYKFRTMTETRDEAGKLLPDEKRLTSFGKILRSWSLDELPELWNILEGDMAFVGPRPLLPAYLPLYNARQRHRHDVRPGLTGLAQIHGRNLQSWEERLEDDVRYTENITFAGDVKILFLTLGAVWKRTGIHSDASETMEPFEGKGAKEP